MIASEPDYNFPTTPKHLVFARPNEKGQVIEIFSDWQHGPKPGDIIIKEGYGDEYAHVSYYELYDHQGLYNYKIVDGEMLETTDEDKAAERATLPKPAPTAEEQILQLQAVVIDLQYQNRLKEMETM